MGKKIRMVLAVALVVFVSFWAFNQIRERSYSGSKIAFDVGNGSLVVNNRGQEAIPVEMRSVGRLATFRVESREINLAETSKRQTIGGTTYHVVAFELPPGQTAVEVVRGSDVQFVSNSSQRIDATVTPMNASSTRTTLIFSGIVVLGALYYLSRSVNHQWVGTVRAIIPFDKLRLKRKAA
ncbi:MAG: hypothetical protein CL608_32585 [Anaerolineaceae bacterium]|nr:hypothetical protein [Anaerolineaceae bacterium]